MRRRAQDEVFAIARQALTDLADSGLEERMCEVVHPALARPRRRRQGHARRRPSGRRPSQRPVRSAFDLPAPQRAAIEAAVHDAFGPDIALRFETAPELVGGIELRTNGQKVAWSIADYLSSLQRGVSELLKVQAEPERRAGAPRPRRPARELSHPRACSASSIKPSRACARRESGSCRS